MRSLALLFIVMLGVFAWAQTPPPKTPTAPTAPAKVESPPELPKIIRGLLGDRMVRHGNTLEALLKAIDERDLNRAKVHAQAIVDEPQLARPLAGVDTINSQVPAEFFTIQDELHGRAKALVEAAGKDDLKSAVAAHAAMRDTCAKCHAVWLPLPRPKAP